MARQLAATAILCLAAGLAQAAEVTWPPGWTLETLDTTDRARPSEESRNVTVDLVRRGTSPATALAAALATYLQGSRSAGFDAGCSNPAPVVLGTGRGTGAGCAVSRNGLPVVKASFVAWDVAGGGSAMLVYSAPPGPFDTYLPAFRTIVASASAP